MMIWRFRRLIEAYGADSTRWPEDELAAAAALLQRSAAARAALAEARELDALLRQDVAAAVDARLADRIIARALAEPRERHPFLSPRPLAGFAGPTGDGARSARVGERVRVRGSLARFGLWPRLAGLAVAGLLGFIVGAADLGPSSFDESVDFSDVVDFNSDLEDPLS